MLLPYGLSLPVQKTDALLAVRVRVRVSHGQLARYILGDEFSKNQQDFGQVAQHMSYSARGGDSVSMDCIKRFGDVFLLSDDDVKDIEQDYNDMKKSEWSEEREEAQRNYRLRPAYFHDNVFA